MPDGLPPDNYRPSLVNTFAEQDLSRNISNNIQWTGVVSIAAISLSQVCKNYPNSWTPILGNILETTASIGLTAMTLGELVSLIPLGIASLKHKAEIPSARTKSIIKYYWNETKQSLAMRAIFFTALVVFGSKLLDHTI